MPSTHRATVKALRANLRRRRNELGITQEVAAERMQIAARHYQKIEAGELNLTLRTLCKLADALRTQPADLVSRRP